MTTRLIQATQGSYGMPNFIPNMLSAFSDFVKPSFSYDFDTVTYTVRPLFFKEWLERYGQLVATRRAFIFDALWHATISYFVMAIKLEPEGGTLDFRRELQGLLVPTYMQDCHSCAPMGGRNHSYPFECKWVFCPMWTTYFKVDPKFWLASIKRLSRYLIEQGFPVVHLDFNTYHDQSSNMITHDYPELNSDQVKVMYDKNNVAKDKDGAEMVTHTVNSVTIRYESAGQLNYNWQTQYYIWWSITCDKFSPIYISMPRQFEISINDLAGLVAGLVNWYFSNRGGQTPVPNFGGSGGPGDYQNPGSGNNPNPGGNNPKGPNPVRPQSNPPRKPAGNSSRNKPVASTTVQVIQPDPGYSNNGSVNFKPPKQGGLTSVIVGSPQMSYDGYNTTADYL